MKSFITYDRNIYYEAPDKLNVNDYEVPKRPSPMHILANGNWIDPHQPQIPTMPMPSQTSGGIYQNTQQNPNLSDLVNVIKQLQTINGSGTPQDPQGLMSGSKKESGFMGDKFTWKDLITVLYFAGGIIGLWMHMNERIIVLEQKVVNIEKGSVEMQNNFKDFTIKNDSQLKNIDSKISDLQQMIVSRISSNSNNGKH